MDRRTLLVGVFAAAALPAGAAAEGGSDKKTGQSSYILIDTLTAYTRKPNGRRGVMTVECGLNIPDPGLRDQADTALPRLRAAYVEILQAYAGGLPAGYPPHPDFLARSLQRQTDQILGRPGARLLLGAILVN